MHTEAKLQHGLDGCVPWRCQILWISLGSASDLLYRLNCHVDKQPVVALVGDLFFAGLRIADNCSRQGEQITP